MIMKTIKRILWTVNLKEDISHSLDVVLDLIRKYGSETVILHIMDKEHEGDMLRGGIEQTLRAELDQLARVLNDHGDYGVRIRLEYGNVLDMMLEVAKDEAVSRVVIQKELSPG